MNTVRRRCAGMQAVSCLSETTVDYETKEKVNSLQSCNL